MFKTMGYSPGFLLKIGRFRNLSNSPQIFTNNLESSYKYICKQIGGVSGSLERFSIPPQIRHLQNHGLQPRLFAQNRSISDPFEFKPNLHQKSRKQLKIYFPANRRRFRLFGTIFGTYPNPPCSKPWAIAQAFCSKSVDFGPFQIHPKSSPTITKVVGNLFASTQQTFQEVWNDFRHLPKSAMFKTMGYSPGFLLKIGRFRTLSNSPQIFTNNLESSYKYICKQIGGVSESLERFSIPTQNPPCSKPWAIAQAFCSKSVDFGPCRIHPKSTPTISKVVKNLYSSKQEAFQRV